MTGLYQQVAVSTGRTDLPIIHRDQLIDPGCLSLLDLAHSWGYKAQASPIAAGTALRNYRRSGSTVTINGTPPWAGGMMLLAGVSTMGLLGTEWRLPPATTHFAIGGYMKIPVSGYPINGSGTASAGFLGWGQTNGANVQYGIRTLYDKATGVAANVYLSMNGQLADVKAYVPADNNVHHYAFEMVVITSTTFQIKMYVDGALVFTSAALTWGGALIVPGSGVPTIGIYIGTYTEARGAIGRLWLWDLTVAGSKSITDLIAADIAQNTGRFS